MNTDKSIPSDIHDSLIKEGESILQLNSDYTEEKMRNFSVNSCRSLVQKVGGMLVKEQLNAVEYTDKQFINALTECIEVGVISFMLENNLYNKYIASPDLLKVICAINYSIAYYMAATFKALKLYNSDKPCVYNNEALGILANRTFAHVCLLKEFEQSVHEVRKSI